MFVDYNQNARDRTVASGYSVRPTPDARVSCALEWDEVPDAEPGDFRLDTVPERLRNGRRPVGRHRPRGRQRSTRCSSSRGATRRRGSATRRGRPISPSSAASPSASSPAATATADPARPRRGPAARWPAAGGEHRRHERRLRLQAADRPGPRTRIRRLAEGFREARSSADPELAIRVAQVELDGGGRHEQRLGDLPVLLPAGRELGDPPLARRERTGAGGAPPTRSRAGRRGARRAPRPRWRDRRSGGRGRSLGAAAPSPPRRRRARAAHVPERELGPGRLQHGAGAVERRDRLAQQREIERRPARRRSARSRACAGRRSAARARAPRSPSSRASAACPSRASTSASWERHGSTAGLTWSMSSARRPHSRSSTTASWRRPCTIRSRPRTRNTHTFM